jgi:choline dehydrogenase-like flavoprotein
LTGFTVPEHRPKKMDWRKVKYDAIVVGSGATGGMAAKCLAEGGAKVLVLEAGPELPSDARGELEKSREEFDAIKARQPVQSRNLNYSKRNCHLFIDDLDNPYTTDGTTAFNWIRSRQVGGRTLIWSRFALRMSEHDLDSYKDDWGGRWPISYGDLAPYYDKVEALIGVSGTTEGVPSLPDGCFLPRRVPSYVRALGKRLSSRFPNRQLIPSREATVNEIGRTAVGPHCLGAGSTLTPESRKTSTVRANCIAARIELDRPNHAKSVVFVDRETHRWSEVEGRVIVLCSSTIESVRLLLASANDDFLTGLANSSGLLGHFLMDHFGGPRVVAVGKISDAEPYSRERAYIPRFCDLSGQSEDFMRGYGIQADFETDAGHNTIITMGVFGEVLPYVENRIELDESTRDLWGLAVPRIRFRYRENETRMSLHARTALQEIVDALGFRSMVTHDRLLAPGTRAHELGGARMGSSPTDSVLNAFNQSWDVRNLFVTDGACFPSAGYKGPTLTMMALTTRACDKILELLRAGAV